jgi:hypothetical protein
MSFRLSTILVIGLLTTPRPHSQYLFAFYLDCTIYNQLSLILDI